MTVAELTYPHRLVVQGPEPHWTQVTVAATAPLTPDGIGAFVRYEDEVATRFGYVVSQWCTEDVYGLHAGVMVYSVHAEESGTAPREHPSNDARFRVVLAEAEAFPDGAGRPVPPAPPGPLLWARRGPDDVPVPVSVGGSSRIVPVRILGAGLLPQSTTLLMGEPDLAERLAGSTGPVEAAVYAYTHRTREKVAARIAAGRVEPTAVLTIGTLEQLGAAGRPT